MPFLLPHVRSGMAVLDVGCGVGSIALDRAPTVAPGRMVGIDAASGQVEAPRRSERAGAHEGGNARYSRRLRTLMLEAGFARTQGVAHAPEVYGDLASTRWFAEFAVGLFAAPSMAEVIVGEGWATRAELDAMIAAL